ncbi:hypothetical protein K2Z84_15935, partial [Candidatus Binatia bacterium]|nr:hypothetical protein [Candidatus Binatia bacterium]
GGRSRPPTAGSARGLRRVRIVDARARGGGIRCRVETLHSTLGDPVAPLLAGVVVGADRADGASGRCGLHVFAADDCRGGPRGDILRCRAGVSGPAPQ